MTDIALPQKSPKVINALRLLYAHLAIAVGAFFFILPGIAERNGIGAFDFWSVFGVAAFFILGFSGGFILEMRKGKNWARITFVVLFYLGVVISIALSFWSPSYCPFRHATFSLEAILAAIACAFLIQPESSAWFKAVKDARRAQASKLLAMELKVCATSDPAYLEAVSTGEPLLVVRYHGYKHVLRICWILFSVMVLGGLALWGNFAKRGGAQMGTIETIVLCSLVIVGVWYLFSLVLLDEIRLYKDRMVQTKKLIGDVEIMLADAGYASSSIIGGRSRPTSLFNRNTKNKWWARITGIRYDESLFPHGDAARLNRLLALLSGRSLDDFRGFSVKLPKLVLPRS